MKKIYIAMSCACVLLAVLAFHRGGWAALAEGLELGGLSFLELIPLLVLAFACAGLIPVVVSRKTITHWLGREAGFKGILIGGLAGALMPGGPFVFYPVAATFMAAGADIGTVIAFVTAKNLWSLSRLPLELALLGPELTFIRYAVTLVIPVLAGLLANLLFGGHTERMREEIRILQHTRRQQPGNAKDRGS